MFNIFINCTLNKIIINRKIKICMQRKLFCQWMRILHYIVHMYVLCAIIRSHIHTYIYIYIYIVNEILIFKDCPIRASAQPSTGKCTPVASSTLDSRGVGSRRSQRAE